MKRKRTDVDGGYNPFAPSFKAPFTLMRVHNPRKTEEMRGAGSQEGVIKSANIDGEEVLRKYLGNP